METDEQGFYFRPLQPVCVDFQGVLRFGSLQMYTTTKGRHAAGVFLLAIGTATPEMAFGATSSRRVGPLVR